MEKTTVFNLIILDESGSMESVADATISGCNEAINVAKSLQEKHTDRQRSFMSLYAFQSGGPVESRYICKNINVEDARHVTHDDYRPYGMTPLYDAVGATLVDLRAIASTHEDAIGIVTIITDGMENASQHFTHHSVRNLIAGLKEMGWTFNFIGANIDVAKVSRDLDIDNVMEWKQTESGTKAMYGTLTEAMECEATSRINEELPGMSPEEKKKLRKARSRKFFGC